MQLLTVTQLSERLNVKPSWVYRNLEQLPAKRLGRQIRFSWEEVERWLEKK